MMHLTSGTEREEQTHHDTRSTVNLQLSLEAESDPKRQFKMIDAWLREYERRNRDWPTLAKMCSEVKVKKLWKLGGFKDWSHWVLDAAPVCAKTVFVCVGTYEELSPDFSDEELREMKPETAKVMTKISTERRRDPEIRAAAKKWKKDFVNTVRTVAPEQHIEDEEIHKFTFTVSQWERIEETFNCYRAIDNPDTSDEDIFEEICQFWMEAKWDGEEDTPYSNEQRARQLMAMKESRLNPAMLYGDVEPKGQESQ